MEGNSCRGGVSIVCDEEGAMLPLVLNFICAVLLPWCSETVPSRQGHQPAVCIEGWQTALASPLPALRALASCQGPYMWWNETPTYSPPKRKKERVHVKKLVKSETWHQYQFPGFDVVLWLWNLEEDVATHSSILAWRIPRTKEPGGLQSMRSQRVRHNWSDLAPGYEDGRSLIMNPTDLAVQFSTLCEYVTMS